MGSVTSIDRRVEQIHVKRSALGVAVENAAAANAMIAAAIDKALSHAWSGNRAGVVHELGRIGFEAQARHAALLVLTNLSETATVCPDGIAAPNHGAAA